VRSGEAETAKKVAEGDILAPWSVADYNPDLTIPNLTYTFQS
jgi:hypothetical protein